MIIKKNSYYSINSCLLGLTLVIFSSLVLIQKGRFFYNLFVVFGVLLLFSGMDHLLKYFKKKEKNQIINFVIDTVGGIFLIIDTNIPTKLLFWVFALYITAHGLIKLISYFILRRNKVNHQLIVLITALLLIFNGISILLGSFTNTDLLMIFFGLYGIALGITYIIDGLFVIIPPRKKDQLKRRIRISAPTFITALIPRMMLEYVNNRLKIENEYSIKHIDTPETIEVFIHATTKGFGTIGHVDVAFDDYVISYGNYDFESVRLFEAIGDGVLFITERDSYIPFCIKVSSKTIFGYSMKLSQNQLIAVKEKLNKIMETTYEWYPKAYYNPDDDQDYASKLYLHAKTKFYKFNKGKFKTYFVLGTNCVQLAENLIGGVGMDIININGIISPGSYQNYLEKEYQRAKGLVVTKNIYNQENEL